MMDKIKKRFHLKFPPLRPEGLVIMNRSQNLCLFPVSKSASASLRRRLKMTERGTVLKKKPKLAPLNFPESVDVSDMIKFTSIRDPFERTVSSYLEVLKLRHDGHRDYTRSLLFFEIKNIEDRFKQFLVDMKKGIWDSHLQPQVFHIYKPDMIDYFIVVENYQDDIRHFVMRYKLRVYGDIDKKDHATPLRSLKLKEQLVGLVRNDKETRRLIKEIYPEDIELYNKIMREK